MAKSEEAAKAAEVEKKSFVLVDSKGKDVLGHVFKSKTPASAARKAVNALCNGKEVEVRLRQRGKKLLDGRIPVRVFKGRTERVLCDTPIFPGQKPDDKGKFPANKAVVKFVTLEYLKA